MNSIDQMISLVKEKGVDIQGEVFQPSPHMKSIHILDPDGLKNYTVFTDKYINKERLVLL